jgi:hypothetical protein
VEIVKGDMTYTEVDLAGFESVHVNGFHVYCEGCREGSVVDVGADGYDGQSDYAFNDRTNARRVQRTYFASSFVMSSKLHTLHKQLLRAFTSQPSDLKTSGRLLAELKVRLVYFIYALGSHLPEPSARSF